MYIGLILSEFCCPVVIVIRVILILLPSHKFIIKMIILYLRHDFPCHIVLFLMNGFINFKKFSSLFFFINNHESRKIFKLFLLVKPGQYYWA